MLAMMRLLRRVLLLLLVAHLRCVLSQLQTPCGDALNVNQSDPDFKINVELVFPICVDGTVYTTAQGLANCTLWPASWLQSRTSPANCTQLNRFTYALAVPTNARPATITCLAALAASNWRTCAWPVNPVVGKITASALGDCYYGLRNLVCKGENHQMTIIAGTIVGGGAVIILVLHQIVQSRRMAALRRQIALAQELDAVLEAEECMQRLKHMKMYVGVMVINPDEQHLGAIQLDDDGKPIPEVWDMDEAADKNFKPVVDGAVPHPAQALRATDTTVVVVDGPAAVPAAPADAAALRSARLQQLLEATAAARPQPMGRLWGQEPVDAESAPSTRLHSMLGRIWEQGTFGRPTSAVPGSPPSQPTTWRVLSARMAALGQVWSGGPGQVVAGSTGRSLQTVSEDRSEVQDGQQGSNAPHAARGIRLPPLLPRRASIHAVDGLPPAGPRRDSATSTMHGSQSSGTRSPAPSVPDGQVVVHSRATPQLGRQAASSRALPMLATSSDLQADEALPPPNHAASAFRSSSVRQVSSPGRGGTGQAGTSVSSTRSWPTVAPEPGQSPSSLQPGRGFV